MLTDNLKTDRRCGTIDWKLIFIYCQCYFITIATLLGTGILGLPVTLSKAGFWPFLLTFTASYVMQLFVIVSTLEVLQYCKAALSQAMHMSLAGAEGSSELLLLRGRNEGEKEDVLFDICERNSNNKESGSEGERECEHDTEDSLDLPPTDTQVTEPNLHMMGKLFLHRYVHPFFLFVLFLHFVSVLISYVLAGSEAYGQIFKVNYTGLIAPFCWTLTALIIVARLLIKPVIALLTLIKGSLLFGTVIVTVYTGMTIRSPVSTGWRYIQGPFLMGTVALGGAPMVMPMLFDKFESIRSHMQGFRNSILGGVTTCFLLNIFWCWSVLNIVPQSSDTCKAAIDVLSAFGENSTLLNKGSTPLETTTPQMQVVRQHCDPDINLEMSDKRGEISTVPLTQIIITQHQELRWIALVIQLFMVISITVSFLTIGSAMQHTICGWVDDIASRYRGCKLTGGCTWLWPRNWFWHYLIGLVVFSVVFAVAVADPKGFVSILEKVASFCLNAMSGPFTFMMVMGARSQTFRHIRISLPTSKWLQQVHYVYLVFYTLAVLYDVVVTSIEWARGDL